AVPPPAPPPPSPPRWGQVLHSDISPRRCPNSRPDPPGSAALGVGASALALFGLASADRGDALGQRDLQLVGGPPRVVEAGELHAREPRAHRPLDPAQICFLVG